MRFTARLPVLCTVAAICCWSSHGWPQTMQSSNFKTDTPYHIAADSLAYDGSVMTYQASGHASIEKDGATLSADEMLVDETTHQVEATGNVRYTSGLDWMEGSRISIDLNDKTGALYDGHLFIGENHFIIRGDEIRKVGESTYTANGTARFTSCDGDNPAWEISGKDLKLTIDGYGIAKHAVFRIKSIPIFYVPIIIFPAKTKRQTGLLIPQVSYSSRDGLEYNLPFFWAINESSDATIYQHYMAHRGFKYGSEYRYALGRQSKGTAMYDFLHDNQIDDSSRPRPDSGYFYEGFRGDSYDRLNQKRWWFRIKSDATLASPAVSPAQLKLDVDLVSDQDYLREFDSGYSSYDSTKAYFSKEFGREIDDKTESLRRNQLSIGKIWNQYSVNGNIGWLYNVLDRNSPGEDDTLQDLISLRATGFKQRLQNSQFHQSFDSSFDYFLRRSGVRGPRLELYPRLYRPTTFFQHFVVEPSVGLRETLWNVERSEADGRNQEDQITSRATYDIATRLSTELSRIFNLDGSKIDRIAHTIQPEIRYEYVHVAPQDNIPAFVERIERKNLVAYSVINRFTARQSRLTGTKFTNTTPPATSSWPGAAATYNDFCRIKISQNYSILEARRHTIEGAIDAKRKPFSSALAEIELAPFQYFKLNADAAWSPYSGDYDSYNTYATVSDKRGDKASLDYRYTKEVRSNGSNNDRDTTKSIISKVSVKVTSPLTVSWEYEKNLETGQSLRAETGIRYESQCWSLGIAYIHDWASQERQFAFSVGLRGLGEAGLGQY